jgi:ribosomal protein S27AE
MTLKSYIYVLKERKMKNTLLTIGTLVAFLAGSTLLNSCGSGNQKDADSAEQHDMDMDHDAADHSQDGESMAATFACPMHPEITGKEGEKCSKCGMFLAASKDDKGDMKDMDMSAMASCPMHPEITGKEGDKCSKCGMKLVLADASDDDHQQ